ncbi:MAG: autotransporter outer membrane beta-barrel domain-containing protein [Kiritimatiellae bacterium]|nr:autotransporter outer membrane beta-barrel domain-containing protein [Kiritimatiellia bacterium]
MGFARALKNKSGVMTFGPIVEYGRGNYSSHLDDGTLGFGDTQFFGVGVFLRQNNTDGLWYEGSLRAGRMKSDYRGDLNNQNVTYDTSSNYFAAHLGVGKVNKVSEKGSLDLYTKLFYAHQAGSDADLSTGEHFDFGSVNSLRWRVGGKYSYRVSKTGNIYAGLAYEYEFQGDATASYQGMSTPSPSVKGGSGLLELGYTIKSGAKSPVTLDFGLNLWTGKKEGIGGTFSVSWAL